MKRVFGHFVSASVVAFALAAAVPDPVQDYLRRDRPRAYADNTTGADSYHAEDKVFRLALDLNNDGTEEVLVSSTKDRDGKQGNIWSVYEPTGSGFIEVGTATFNQQAFYVGPIDQNAAFGLVTFHPGGAGEGTVDAYVLEARILRERRLADIKYNPVTNQVEGRDVLAKYKATGDSEHLTIIDSGELAQKYGVTVSGKTTLQSDEETVRAFHEKQRQSGTSSTATPSQAQFPGLASSASGSMSPNTSVPIPQVQASPSAAAEGTRPSAKLLIVLVTGILVLFAAATVLVVRRKR